MQKDLIKELCLTQGLIDVNNLGQASQSSLHSKLSKENDAQRAIDGTLYEDFSFHTGKQKNPWWQVEFDDSINPEYIIINNRNQNKWRRLASKLEVYIVDDGGELILIHKGQIFFGTIHDSVPLILPLAGNIRVKSILLRMPGTHDQHLHLGQISILCALRPKLSEKNQLVFISKRGDGLGERLRALLNAMVLAKKCNGKFLFSWPSSFSKDSFHAIDEVNNIFGKVFIEDCLIDKATLDNCILKPVNEISNLDDSLYNGFQGVGIFSEQPSLKSQLKDKRYLPDDLNLEYRNAFESIVFSDEVIKAQKLAHSIVLKDKVLAIHLRSGDLVYGRYRFMDRYYDKVIPLYVIDTLINRFKNLGYDIVLFGQDQSACRRMSEIYDVINSNDLADITYNDVQLAMFDITLMSRCTEIVCGMSGFAIIASWIGNAKLVKYTEIMSNHEILSSFKEAISSDGILSDSEIKPLLKAFSISHFVKLFGDSIPLNEKVLLLEQCLVFDSENNFYKIPLSLLYYENGNFDKADDLILDIINTNSQCNLKFLVATKFPKENLLCRFVGSYKEYADEGSLLAGYMMLVNSIYYTKNIDFDYFNELLSKKSIDTKGYKFYSEELKKVSDL